MKRANKHIGSNFDDFLKEEGILEEAKTVAIKKALAFLICVVLLVFLIAVLIFVVVSVAIPIDMQLTNILN